MVANSPPDHSRLFLHPTENQLWANANDGEDPVFPKFSDTMLPVCDKKQYEQLLETLSQIFKDKDYNNEEESGYGTCLANFLCIASLGICFCPFLYWTCRKNKGTDDQNQFETKVSALVDKQTEHWPGKVTIRREIIHTHGEESHWEDQNGNTLQDSEGTSLKGPPHGWNLIFHLPNRPEWPINKDTKIFNAGFKDNDTSSESMELNLDSSCDDLAPNISRDDTDSNWDQTFSDFIEASDILPTLNKFNQLCIERGLNQNDYTNVFSTLESKLKGRIPFRYRELFHLLSARGSKSEYKNSKNVGLKKVLVIGAGPCGLRMAIELLFLGVNVTVIEARPYFDRNNVIKLWHFVMEDLKTLGAKKIYAQLGTGSVNHVSIRVLQTILLKIALILGAKVRTNEIFKQLLEPTEKHSWISVTEIKDESGKVMEHKEEFDIIVCAAGRNVPLQGFERKSLDAKLSIAITANFTNKKSLEERRVKEIPGLSRQYDQEFFKTLVSEKKIRLENIVYYQNDTHYFVMTAKKDSLLQKGVILRDHQDRSEILKPENINRNKLEIFAREAASFSTNYYSKELPPRPFAKWKGKNDVSIFDFTNVYSSKNASRIKSKNGNSLLLSLVGDSLIEPFWPEGTGIGRGFLSVFDTAWMIRRYLNGDDQYEVVREREKLYSLLRQTGDDKLKGNYKAWSINPVTRYTTTTFHFNQERVQELIDIEESKPKFTTLVSMRRKISTKRKYSSKIEDFENKRKTTFYADTFTQNTIL